VLVVYLDPKDLDTDDVEQGDHGRRGSPAFASYAHGARDLIETNGHKIKSCVTRVYADWPSRPSSYILDSKTTI
jgi:hypothetical protein